MDEQKNLEQAKMEKVVYDPSKNYKWQPTDIFPLDGMTFDMARKSLQAIVGTNEAQVVIIAYETLKRLNMGLKGAVENGVAKEVVEEEVIKGD